MDTALTRVEKKKLCFLLDLPPQCYGNVPMMKSRYKRACLKLHPDKGGEDLLMKELNMLWQKFQEGIFNLRRDIPSFEEDEEDEEEDDTPIYGTPKFKAWWYSKYARWSQGSNDSSSSKSSSRRSSGRARPDSGYSSSQQDSDPSAFPSSQASNSSDGQSQQRESAQHPGGASVPPEGFQSSHAGHHNGSGSEESSSGRGSQERPTGDAPTGKQRWRGGNLFGNSSRVPPPNWDDSLRCDESLSSPEVSAGEEDPPTGSESSSQYPQDSTTEEATEPEEQPEEHQHAGPSSSSFSTPRTPPSRRRKFTRPQGFPRSPDADSYSSTPPRPKKPKENDLPNDFPPDTLDYLSHAVYSNKTVTTFAIYTTLEKSKLLYQQLDKFKVDFKSRHKCPRGGIILCITLSRHRVSAVKNHCANFCTVSFLIVKGVIKILDLYRLLKEDPYRLIEENKSLYNYDFAEKSKEQTCNWNLVADFAFEYRLDDPLVILAHYLDFAKPYPCGKCFTKTALKPHKAHEKEHQNAKLFMDCKSQKSICQQAADIVIAKSRLEMMECTREELLEKKMRKVMERLRDFEPKDLKLYMAGVAWYCNLFNHFELILFKIIKFLTENIPKHRNVMFKGEVNSGKTSLAAAIIDLLEGKALNINCPADKLNFELGCALDRFCVVFEDVKGQAGPRKDLPPGQGFNNLDNLRDHMDGAVPVSLERKHVNKKHQIFPPIIVTCNHYVIPVTVQARICFTLNFVSKPNLKTSLDKNLEIRRRRVLQSGTTLLLCLIYCLPMRLFADTMVEDVRNWRQIINQEVGWDTYCKMLENIEAGDDPLRGVDPVEEEEEENDDTTQ
ncbi:large T antigen [Eidolon polyomavirus 1]|uniref:DNA 3'-5' helicase n=1 Tax=Eidolon polyomavirus 1 TaxID=1891722 RepID=L0GBB5_9POLY|nr:large T antigen [Eidolon polyomavirus 1]AGA82588.1 large T antigen [Eidolon polyomavirus 1]